MRGELRLGPRDRFNQVVWLPAIGVYQCIYLNAVRYLFAEQMQ